MVCRIMWILLIIHLSQLSRLIVEFSKKHRAVFPSFVLSYPGFGRSTMSSISDLKLFWIPDLRWLTNVFRLPSVLATFWGWVYKKDAISTQTNESTRATWTFRSVNLFHLSLFSRLYLSFLLSISLKSFEVAPHR